MKKTSVILIVALVAGIFLWAMGSYNRLVSRDEGVQKAWAQVENVYKRRADLVPQLVATVQGAADFEKSTMTEVVNARAGVDNVKVDPATLSPDQVAAYQKAQDKLGQAVASTIKVTVERYPELTATQGFRDLQTQLEGTENRIAVERGKFNEAVQVYNTSLRRFPTNLVAGLFGFQAKGYFTAPEGSDEPVKVEFNF